MRVIRARNVHQALPEAIHQLQCSHVEEDSRNGTVWVSPEPVATVYTHPRERVVFWPERDANPFFHFYEALWMLGGRNDVASLTRFVKRMQEFSDDGTTFHGAYGHRWRKHFGDDQLAIIIANLKANPGCRRQVLQIYDNVVDLVINQNGMRDIPCNLAVHFMMRWGALDMTVFNRSNDIIWGCYGANAVHFSMLQEYVATGVGVPVGQYWQISDNWHGYLATLKPLLGLADQAAQPPSLGVPDPYLTKVQPFRLINTDVETWNADLDMFLSQGCGAMGYLDVFFRRVALPILMVHDAYRAKHYDAARSLALDIKASDWRLAIQEWLNRREARRESSKGTA